MTEKRSFAVVRTGDARAFHLSTLLSPTRIIGIEWPSLWNYTGVASKTFKKEEKMQKKTVLSQHIVIPSNGKLVIEKVEEGAGLTYFRLSFDIQEQNFILVGGSEEEVIKFADSLKDSINNFIGETKEVPV